MMDLKAFEDLVKAAVDPVAAPSIAYGISLGEETLLVGSVGYADKERGILATPQTAYSLASVTKPLTSTAVMLLADRGLVDIEAPIERYLGGLKLDGKAGDSSLATVRRVADHSSGLPLHYQFYYADEPETRPPFAETVRRYGKLFSFPSLRYQYSNLGYGLLDALIAEVSGRTYTEFMAEELFAPLGMSGASIDALDGAAIAYGPDGIAYARYDFDHPGGSAAYANVEDLLKFGQFHLGYGPDLLSIARREAMQRPSSISGENQFYGFGWGISQGRLPRTIQHTGGMGGVSTIVRLVPDAKLTIVILVNGESNLPWRLSEAAIEAALGITLDPPKPPSEPAPVPSDFWGTWTGNIETYQATLPFTLEIKNGTEAVARLAGTESKVDDLKITNGRLSGIFDGDLQTEDAARRPYRIHLDLDVHESLRGTAVAITHLPDGSGGAPGKRIGNALASWTHLER